jgi:hypothetical protein
MKVGRRCSSKSVGLGIEQVGPRFARHSGERTPGVG